MFQDFMFFFDKNNSRGVVASPRGKIRGEYLSIIHIYYVKDIVSQLDGKVNY